MGLGIASFPEAPFDKTPGGNKFHPGELSLEEEGAVTENPKARMAADPGEPPGMERDSRGRPIPLAARLPEDRAEAVRARKKKAAKRSRPKKAD